MGRLNETWNDEYNFFFKMAPTMASIYESQFAFVKDDLKLEWTMDERTEEDGNCFYNSVVQQLGRPEVRNFLLKNGLLEEYLSWSPNEMREQLCNWLDDQLTLMKNDGQPTGIGQFLLDSEEKDIQTCPDWKAFNVTTMEKFLKIQKEGCAKHGDMAWANYIIVQGMACFLNINIKVATKTDKGECLNTIRSGSNMIEVSDVFLTIANYRQKHFQSFIPTNQRNRQNRVLSKIEDDQKLPKQENGKLKNTKDPTKQRKPPEVLTKSEQEACMCYKKIKVNI